MRRALRSSDHGSQVNGENYLIPVGFKFTSAIATQFDAVPAARVTYTLRPGDSLYSDAEEEHDFEPLTPEVRYPGIFTERPPATNNSEPSTECEKEAR